MELLLSATAVVLTVTLGIVWFSRAGAVRRLNAALDAYAVREINRQPRGNVSRRVPFWRPPTSVKGEDR
jgi:hypothetical protein